MTSNEFFMKKSRELQLQNFSKSQEDTKRPIKTPPRNSPMNTISERGKLGFFDRSRNEKPSPSIKIKKQFFRRATLPVIPSALLNKPQIDTKPVLSSLNFPPDLEKIHIVLFGGSKVGKTALAKKFLNNEFVEKYVPTIENSYIKSFNIHGKELVTTILDTSGNEAFPAMRSLHISNGDGFLLVYAIDDFKTWELIKQLRDEIITKRGENVPIVIVANKCDLEEKREIQKIPTEMQVEIEWRNGFIETSAKTKDVLDVFSKLLQQAKILFPLNSINGSNNSVKKPSMIRIKSAGRMNLSCIKGDSPRKLKENEIEGDSLRKLTENGNSMLARTKSGNCKVQ